MPAVTKDNAVAAKAKALYGGRITNSDYQNLLELSTVREIAEYLKNRTSYSEVFTAKTVSNEITPEVAEQLITTKNENNITKIGRFSCLIGDDFYKLTIVTSDIRVLMYSARLIVVPTARDDIYIPDDFCKKHSKLKHDAIYNAQSAQEFMKAIKGTVYHAMLKPYVDLMTNSFDMPGMEAVLYNYRSEIILNHCKGDKKAQKQLTELFKLDIDKFNISTIYRLKKYSDKNPERIRRYISENYGFLTQKQLNELVDSQSDEEFINILSSTKFGSIIKSEDLTYIEGAVDRVIAAAQRKLLKQSDNPDVQAYAYIQFARNEARNLCKIIEGKKYGLSKEEISSFIIN